MPSDCLPEEGAVTCYRPARKSARQSGGSDLLFNLTAPVVASRLFFPRLLENSIDRVRNGGQALFVANAHARWFFGQSLVFWADPGKLQWRLKDCVYDGQSNIQLSRRFIDDGEWTNVITKVADTAEHGETLELVAYGRRYPRSRTFRRMVVRARKNKPMRRYGIRLDTEDKVHAYFRYFLALIDSVRQHGLQDSGALGGLNVPIGVGVRGRHVRDNRNIGVAIASDGRLLRFLGGRHRTAIAQALGLAAVPVEIRLVHAGWLAEETAHTGLTAVKALQDWVRRAPDPRSYAKRPLVESFGDLREWRGGQAIDGVPVPGE